MGAKKENQKKYKLLGELITKGIRMVAAQQDWTLTATHIRLGDELGISPDAIYKWRTGFSRPGDQTLIAFLRLVVTLGNADRKYGRSLLQRAGFQPRVIESVLDSIFGKEELATLIPNNLPQPFHFTLIGRSEEVEEIIHRLHPKARNWIVPLEGLGGVGKTALALEIGWHYVEDYAAIPVNERFEAIIWASAKPSRLTTDTIESQIQQLTNLGDLYRSIADVLNHPAILHIAPDKQPAEVAKVLRQRRVLFILDNLETVDDPAVFDFIRDLPFPSKAIATMRFHEDMPYPIRLQELSPEAARELVLLQLRIRGIGLDEDQIESLREATQGLPLAIWWAVGLMSARGYGVQAVIDRLHEVKGDLLSFIFCEAVTSLKQNHLDAYYLLLAFSLFPSSVALSALAHTAGVDDERAAIALNYLVNLNLVNRTKSSTHFTVLPQTRYYASAELSEIPEWEYEARQRWAHWSEEVTQKMRQSRGNFKAFEQEVKNIFAVMGWLYNQGTIPRLAVFITNTYHYLYDEGYWNDLRPFYDGCMKWALETANRQVISELLEITYIAEEEDMATEWLGDIEALGIRCGDELLLAQVNLEKGRQRYNDAKFEEAITLLEAALQVFKGAENLQGTVRTLNRLGHAYRRRRASSSDKREDHDFYKQAFGYYTEGKDLMANCTNPVLREEWSVLFRLSIGILSYLAGRFPEARNTLRSVMPDLFRQRSYATLYITLAVVEYRLGNQKQARELGMKGENLIDRLRLARPIHFADKEWLAIREQVGIRDYSNRSQQSSRRGRD